MHAASDRLTRASISCAHFPMRHKFEEEEEDFQISCVHQIVRRRESRVSIKLPSKKATQNPTEKITENAVLKKAIFYSTGSVTFSVGFWVAFSEGN